MYINNKDQSAHQSKIDINESVELKLNKYNCLPILKFVAGYCTLFYLR